MDIAGKFIALGGWVFFLYLGFRRTSRKQNKFSEKGGGFFYFVSFLWAFASLVIYLAIYNGKEEPNLTRTFQEKTCFIWRTYRNEQLWIRTSNEKFLIAELPATNNGCQNVAWINPETIALILKTPTGIFQYQESKQFFSIWVAKAQKNASIIPINFESIQALKEIIRKNPEQLGTDLNNFDAIVQEYNLENMTLILKSDENPNMASYVASIIGDLEGQAAIPVLLDALQKKEKKVYFPVLSSLAKLAKKFPEIPFLVHQRDFEHQKEDRFRLEVAKLFGASNDNRLIQPLIRWISDEEEPKELRQEVLIQLNLLTQQKFEYDPLVNRTKRIRQLEVIENWYNENKEDLLAKYPKTTLQEDPKNTETDPKNTETDPKNTETDPKNTETDPKNTETNKTETIATVDHMGMEEKSLFTTYQFRFKDLFLQAYQTGLNSSYFDIKESTGEKVARPLLHGIPETRFIEIKAQLKENLKQELARPHSVREQQIRLQALAFYLQSNLPLEQITAQETLQEWSEYENEAGKAFIAKLLQK